MEDGRGVIMIVNGREVRFTRKEWGVLSLLIGANGKLLDDQTIANIVWGGVVSHVVKVYIGYLRNKIGKKSIITRRGFGYALNTKKVKIIYPSS